jgi:steroid Delta-isomerase
VNAVARHADRRLARLIEFYETLSPAALARLPELYAPDAHFKDPFNEVQGPAAIEAVFRHMYRTLEGPRFVVQRAAVDGRDAFLIWRFLFGLRRDEPGRERCIRGATHLEFDASGRVAAHRDYWDAAEELYETLPALGPLMRWLKRRVAA